MVPRWRRSRTIALLVGILAGALALGVVAALIVNAAILGPGRADPGTGSDPSPEPSASKQPSKDTVAASLLAEVRSGVVSVVASTCAPVGWAGRAAGAVIGPRRVVTAWSGVADPVSIAVIGVDGAPVPAVIERADPRNGIAVLRTARPLLGHRFAVAETKLSGGQQWYGLEVDQPRGKAASIRSLRIAQNGKTAKLGRDQVTGIAVSSVSAAKHLGGGPVIGRDGRLVGVTARYPGHNNLVVLDAARIGEAIKKGASPAKASCATPLGPSGTVRPRQGRHEVVESYVAAINSGQYDKAWALYGEPMRGQDRAEFVERWWRSRYIFNLRLNQLGDGKVLAEFDAIFAKGRGHKGLSCIRSSSIYTVKDGKIVNNEPARGDKAATAC